MTDILFITDGGPTQGMGHVFQSLAVASAVARTNVGKIRFAAPPESVAIQQKIQDSDYELMDWNDIGTRNSAFLPDTVVIDTPQPNTELIETVSGAKTVVYGSPETNLSPSVCKKSNVIVSPLSITEGLGGRKQQTNGATHFVGPPYLILREDFDQYAGSYKTNQLDHILLTFGGADPRNLTTETLLNISNVEYEKISVVLGPAFDHHDEFASAVADVGIDDLDIYQDTNEMASLMYQSDLVVTSPGLSMFESIYIGVPTVGIVQNEDQQIFFDTEFVYEPTQITHIEKIIKATYRDSRQVENMIGDNKKAIIDTIQSHHHE